MMSQRNALENHSVNIDDKRLNDEVSKTNNPQTYASEKSNDNHEQVASCSYSDESERHKHPKIPKLYYEDCSDYIRFHASTDSCSSDESQSNISDIDSSRDEFMDDLDTTKLKSKTDKEIMLFEGDYGNYIGKINIPGMLSQGKLEKREETPSLKNNEIKSKLKVLLRKSKVAKKRPRNPDSWKRRAAALLREKGLSYLSQTGKQIPEKRPNDGMLCNEKCRLKCSDKFNNEKRKKLFTEFYKLDVNSKNTLLFSCIVLKTVQRVRKNAQKHKSASYYYQVICDGEITRVCKTALCSLYQVGRKKIDHLQCFLKDGLSAPPPDRRGKHQNRPHKINKEEDCVLIP